MAAITNTSLVGPSESFHGDLPNGGPGEINSITDFIVYQSRNIPSTPLIAYPGYDTDASGFVDHTAEQLDTYADETAKWLSDSGLRPTLAKTDKAEVVGLLGPSNLDYVVSLLALTRMGFSVLLLSTRLPTEAYVSLLEKTSCQRIIASANFIHTVTSIKEAYAVQDFRLPDSTIWSRTPSGPRFRRETELRNEENTVAFIVHSSGSTGLPKPIFQTHRQCLSNYAVGSGMRAFVTLPLFHNHGLSTTFRGILAGKRTMLYNASLPLTNQNLVAAMKAANFESFHCVPYALKVLAETEEGLAQLARAKLVLFGGSSCPDDLGDLLVQHGVNIVSHYGATEMGQLLTSQRDQTTDHAWNYLRPLPQTNPYLLFDEINPGIFELVVLSGLPSKTMSNSDDPLDSFRTRDTFVKHPTLNNAWKYLGRLDDRITLVNGEKVLPVPFEHRVRQHELVQDCLMFGVGRAFPGLLIFPGESARSLEAEELLDILWPTIQSANQKAEHFGRVSREMVKILPAGSEYPRTDKGTVIRAASYNLFSNIIEQVYQDFEAPSDVQALSLELADLQDHLLRLLTERIDVADLDLDTDVFAAGLDSLQAITARAHIARELDVGGNALSQQVVFEHPSVRQLAAYLHALRTGSALEIQTEEQVMRDLVAKYSTFQPFTPGHEKPDGEVILLTGATGSLGAHILSKVVALPHVRRVYCLVRASSRDSARERVTQSLTSRGLSGVDLEKVNALPADLGQSDLGLGKNTYNDLSRSLTSVIHSAWAVNFNLSVRSFEAQYIAGLRHLLDLCLSVPFSQPARLAFISSISAAAGTPSPATIPETIIEDPSHAQNMGYARSKWVAEHIVHSAASTTGMNARVLRSGQIIGDSILGHWNATEAIPLMFRSTEVIGALPDLDENPSWLPVDKCAQAILELSGLPLSVSENIEAYEDETSVDGPDVVYNVQNPKTVSWTQDVLPALAAGGLKFDIVGQREWIQRLRQSEQDPNLNPTIKLLDFFAEKYDNDKPGRSGLVFETSKAEERSAAIAEFYDVVSSGLLGRCVQSWKNTWT